MSNDIIIAVILKNEIDYIEEFIDYHINLGFDKVIIADNNDYGGETYNELLKYDVKDKRVKILNYRGKEFKQLDFYNYVIDNFKYKWCAFIDCDEFITFGKECKFNNIKDYLNQFDNIDAIKMNWEVYGDNGLTYYFDDPVVDRFTKPMPVDFIDMDGTKVNITCKSIVNGNVKNHFTNTPHTILGINYILPDGEVSASSPFNEKIDYSVLYVRHYFTKSLSEWCENKMVRNRADEYQEDPYSLDVYFYYNEKTSVKEKYLIDNKIGDYGINDDVDIFIYSHKAFTPIVKNKVYKVLTNTHDGIGGNLPVYRDYVGDNIANKNLMYNEYTGFYWLWKNYDLKDYVGLNHYRRYYEWLDNVPNIKEIFNTHSIVLNRPIYFKESVEGARDCKDNRTWYSFWHNVDDFDLFVDMMHKEFPEYNDGVQKMIKADYLYNSSMFIMKKEDFKTYCEFIFKVLDKYIEYRDIPTVEASIKSVEEHKEKYLKPHLPYYTVEIQARILGYIAERAMNAYIMNGNNSFEKNAYIESWKMV